MFSKCRNSGNRRNCTIFGTQEDLGGPFDSPYVDLGVTSRDLSMTLTFLKLAYMDVSPKTVGVAMVGDAIWGNRN